MNLPVRTIFAASCVFLLAGPLAAASSGEDILLPLAPGKLLPYAETAGPPPPFPKGFSNGAGAGAPVLLARPGPDSPRWTVETGWCFDLGKRFLPVSGEMLLRVRIRPSAPGKRTLSVFSYNRRTRLSIIHNGESLYSGELRNAQTSVPLELSDRNEITVTLGLTPLYKYSFLALRWEGGENDFVAASRYADLSRAVLESIPLEFSPRAPLPGETLSILVPTRAVPPSVTLPPLTLEIPGGKRLPLSPGRQTAFILPRTESSAAWEIFLSGGGRRRTIRLPNPAGIRTAFLRLKAEADKIPLDERERFPVFLLRVAQLEEMLRRNLVPKDWGKALSWVEEAALALERERRGEHFYASRKGFREDAYVSKVDLSPQPFLLYVPSNPPRPAPLVVFLHGYVPDYQRAGWLTPNPMELALYEKRGAFFLVPFGRSNTDFLTVGERDVLDAVTEVRKRFPIDQERILLIGYSMGGSGAWTMLCHYPDLFAAALILAGRTDFYLWRDLRPSELSPWLNYMIRTDNPVDLAENAARIPVVVLHGTADWVVKQAHSSTMVRRLRDLGAPVKFFRLPGADHWSAGRALFDDKIIDMLFNAPKDRLPKATGNYVVYTPKYGRLGGLTVKMLAEWMRPGRVSFPPAQGQGAFQGVNCERIGIVSPPPGMSQGPPGFEKASGNNYVRQGLFRNGRSPALLKTPGLCGPFKEVLCGPFAIVFGTGGARPEKLRSAAEEWATMWFDFAKGKALVYPDTDLPEEVFRSRNLLIIGTPRENSVAARLASAGLPFKFIGDRLVLLAPDGEEIDLGGDGPGEGYIVTYPNPFTGRYAAFTGATVWGKGLPVNHKWDFVPDIVVFRRGGKGFQGSDEYLRAGFFDSTWRVDTKLLFKGHLAPSP